MHHLAQQMLVQLFQQLQKLNPLLSGHSEPATPAHYADMQDIQEKGLG